MTQRHRKRFDEGRPKRLRVLRFRMNDVELAGLLAAAKALGVTPSAFMRDAIAVYRNFHAVALSWEERPPSAGRLQRLVAACIAEAIAKGAPP